MPTETEALHRRRKTLIAATATLGGMGVVATMIPFIETMSLSEAARAAGAPVKVELAQIAPGQLLSVAWRGKPVWIVHRTDDMLRQLSLHDSMLQDPQSQHSQQPADTRNAVRSVKPDYFVAVGICTHLGCVPLYRPQAGSADLGASWPGGFYCPCHGSRFDLAGRVFKNVPAPRNLDIPPHRYLAGGMLEIGAGSQA